MRVCALLLYLRHLVPSARSFWQEGPFLGKLDSISIYCYHRQGSCARPYRPSRKPLPGVMAVCAFFFFPLPFFLPLACLALLPRCWGLGRRLNPSSIGRFSELRKILCSGPVTRLVGRNRVPKPGLRGNAGVGTEVCDMSQMSLIFCVVRSVRDVGTVDSFLGHLSHATLAIQGLDHSKIFYRCHRE